MLLMKLGAGANIVAGCSGLRSPQKGGTVRDAKPQLGNMLHGLLLACSTHGNSAMQTEKEMPHPHRLDNQAALGAFSGLRIHGMPHCIDLGDTQKSRHTNNFSSAGQARAEQCIQAC